MGSMGSSDREAVRGRPIGVRSSLVGHEDLVDGNVHELDEEAHEAHDQEAHARRPGDLDEFLPVGLCALLHEVHGVFDLKTTLAQRQNARLTKSFSGWITTAFTSDIFTATQAFLLFEKL